MGSHVALWDGWLCCGIDSWFMGSQVALWDSWLGYGMAGWVMGWLVGLWDGWLSYGVAAGLWYRRLAYGVNGRLMGWLFGLWGQWLGYGVIGCIMGWLAVLWGGWLGCGMDGWVMGSTVALWDGWLGYGVAGYVMGWLARLWGCRSGYGSDGSGWAMGRPQNLTGQPTPQVHCNNMHTRGVSIFTAAECRFKHSLEAPWEPPNAPHHPEGATGDPRARWVTVSLGGRRARFVKCRFFFAGEWMLFSEVTFVSGAALRGVVN